MSGNKGLSEVWCLSDFDIRAMEEFGNSALSLWSRFQPSQFVTSRYSSYIKLDQKWIRYWINAGSSLAHYHMSCIQALTLVVWELMCNFMSLPDVDRLGLLLYGCRLLNATSLICMARAMAGGGHWYHSHAQSYYYPSANSSACKTRQSSF